MEFNPVGLEHQIRAAVAETEGAPLDADGIVEVLRRQRDPGKNFDLVAGWVLGMYEAVLGVPGHVVAARLRAAPTMPGITGAKVCMIDHVIDASNDADESNNT